VGNGLAEVGLLAALTVIVLPCCFFTLLALLDRLERNLDPGALAPPQLVVTPTPIAETALTAETDLIAETDLDDEGAGGDVVSLPIAVTVADAPAAATG
jgi:hypothetical protein